MSDRARVTFVGTLPPPVTGMTLATSNVVERLRARCDLRVYDISHPRFNRGVPWRAVKAWKVLTGALQLLLWDPGADPRLYAVANAGAGLWYTLLHVAVARLRGYHLFLHHQVFNYVDRYDRRMALIVRLMGAHGTHVLLCPRMETEFRRRYAPRGHCMLVPNSIVMLDGPPPDERDEHVPFRIGHLSNLTLEKGLAEVLGTLTALRRRGVDVRLILAGPAATSGAARLIERARSEHGRALDYRGPVYGRDKDAFYADIDAVLFPTRYRREAYPLVLAEALMAGIPVVTYARACIPSLVSSDGGHVLDPDEDFEARAAEIVETWAVDQASYRDAARRARSRGASLREEAATDLDRLLDRMVGK